MQTEQFTLKRKPGPPKGSRPSTKKPQSVAEYVREALENPIQPKKDPKSLSRPGRSNGIWGTFKTAEERSAYARHLRSLPTKDGKPRARRTKGHTSRWGPNALEAAKAAVELQATELVDRLKSQGAIPKNDPETAEEVRKALVILRSPVGESRTRKAVARQLLHHFHPDLRNAEASR